MIYKLAFVSGIKRDARSGESLYQFLVDDYINCSLPAVIEIGVLGGFSAGDMFDFVKPKRS